MSGREGEMTTHPAALAWIVAALSGILAWLAPRSGRFDIPKHFIEYFVGLLVMIGLLAAVGKAFHDFMFE